MKILYFLKYFDTPMFQWQKIHIFDELAKHNVQIELFNPLDYPHGMEANERLIQRVRKGNVDLLMTTATHEDLFIDTIKQIKQEGVPTLLFCPDNLTIPFAHKKIAPYFDLVWLTSIETQYLFDKWGVNSIFLPYAANPSLYYPQTHEIQKVVFIGSPYGSRCKMINNLLEGNINVDLYHGGRTSNSTKSGSVNMKNTLKEKFRLIHNILDMLSYPIGRRLATASLKNKLMKMSVLDENNAYLCHYPGLPFNEMMGKYNSYGLSLRSITNRHTGVLKNPVPVLNLRNFEIATAGGILFSLFTPELNSYFEDGKEAIYYHADEEMVDKARFYLADEQYMVRQKIKTAARNKAIHEHAWINRFSVLFDRLGLSNYAK